MDKNLSFNEKLLLIKRQYEEIKEIEIEEIDLSFNEYCNLFIQEETLREISIENREYE